MQAASHFGRLSFPRSVVRALPLSLRVIIELNLPHPDHGDSAAPETRQPS
jgi:hypothetical protein